MEIIDVISKDRLGKYLKATGFDQERALSLYGWNIQISEAFFPVLSAAEVSLRNTISGRFEQMYGTTWWENPTFMEQFSPQGRGIIRRAQDNRAKKGPVTSGGMTAELNFGFWSKMLLPKHENHFWSDLSGSFRYLPPNVDYVTLYRRCDSIRSFRNRIFHHEPIFSCDISKEHSDIMELVTWLSPEKAIWIKKYSRVMSVLRAKP